MLNNRNVDAHNIHSLFKQAVFFAKNKNKIELRRLIENYVFPINIKLKNVSVIELLAREGEHDAVYFLIDHFYGSINQAVKGAAYGGHDGLVRGLIKLGASLDLAVTEAASKLRYKLVEFLQSQGANANYILLGAAISGEEKWVEELLNKSKDNELPILLGYAITGAAFGNHVHLLNHLILKSKGFLSYLACLNKAVDGAGLNCQINLILNLLQQGADKDNAVIWMAANGEIKISNDLLNAGAKKNYALKGAAYGGHYHYVNYLVRKGANKHFILPSLLVGQQFDLLFHYIEFGKIINLKLSHQKVFEDAYFLKNTQALNIFMTDEVSLSHLAESIKMVTDNPHLYRKEMLAFENKDKSFRTSVFIKDPWLADLFINTIFRIKQATPNEIPYFLYANNEISVLQEKRYKLIHLMKNNDLTYEDAYTYLHMPKNLRLWIFLGPQFVLQLGLQKNIYYKILADIAHCNYQEAKLMHDVAYERTKERHITEAESFSLKTIYNFFRFNKRTKVDIEEIKMRWDKRKNFKPMNINSR